MALTTCYKLTPLSDGHNAVLVNIYDGKDDDNILFPSVVIREEAQGFLIVLTVINSALKYELTDGIGEKLEAKR